jgi:hypothetical protein
VNFKPVITTAHPNPKATKAFTTKSRIANRIAQTVPRLIIKYDDQRHIAMLTTQRHANKAAGGWRQPAKSLTVNITTNKNAGVRAMQIARLKDAGLWGNGFIFGSSGI